MEDITDADLAHAKRVYKDFEIKNSGEHCELYDQSNTLLLADTFGNLQETSLEIYSYYTRISMAISLKKDQSQIF